jgi:parallel beta-helix repeat protein
MRIFKVSSAVAAVLAGAVFIFPVSAATWRVPLDAPTIQAGIDLASSGDTVLVACGTYYEHDIRMRSGVCLRSETGEAGCVTIDAQQQDRVIYCRFVANTTRIEGFTITGGLPPHSMEVRGDGAGLYCVDNSRPRVSNCTFAGNSAVHRGGGAYCGANSSVAFVGCTFSGNSAAAGSGGGMCFEDNSDVTVTDCMVSDNSNAGILVLSSGTAAVFTDCFIYYNPQGGMRCTNRGHVTVTNCRFRGNGEFGSRGGGIFLAFDGSAAVTDTWFVENSASSGGGMVLSSGSSATLTNCQFRRNAANSNGGALQLSSNGDASSVTLTGCKIFSNSAKYGGGIHLEGSSYLSADTTEFAGNTASIEGPNGYVEGGSEVDLTCCVPNLIGFAGEGTINLHNEGCFSPIRKITWGKLKAAYGRR